MRGATPAARGERLAQWRRNAIHFYSAHPASRTGFVYSIDTRVWLNSRVQYVFEYSTESTVLLGKCEFLRARLENET